LLQKIDAYNRELHISEQEGPGETASVKNQDDPLLAPAGNELTIRTGELLAGRRCGRLVRENLKTRARINEVTPSGKLVDDVDQRAGDDGVEPPPAT
jgi:hypothetical protein